MAVKLAQAIAREEGFGPVQNLPTRANNPGDLTGADAGSFPTLGIMNAEGVIHFARVEDGWTRLYVKTTRMLYGPWETYQPTDTLLQAGIKYSGGNLNWGPNVANFLGVSPGITLKELGELS